MNCEWVLKCTYRRCFHCLLEQHMVEPRCCKDNIDLHPIKITTPSAIWVALVDITFNLTYRESVYKHFTILLRQTSFTWLTSYGTSKICFLCIKDSIHIRGFLCTSMRGLRVQPCSIHLFLCIWHISLQSNLFCRRSATLAHVWEEIEKRTKMWVRVT
jgi:hypothetical protein